MCTIKSLFTRIASYSLRTRNFHTSKCTSLFHEFPDKDGYLKKPDEQIEWEKLSLRKRMMLEMELYKEGLVQFVKNMYEQNSRGPRVLIQEQVVDTFWRFTGDPEELKRWIITTDRENNIGFSTASLDFTKNSKGLFHGFLDTKLPSDGKIKNTGYCNLRLTPTLGPWKSKERYDWTYYTHLVFRIRGDGRVYAVNLHLETKEDVCMYDCYHYFIWTRGGPYWQHVRIPFSKFFFAYKGRLQASQAHPLPTNEVASISFTIADKITGPFRLEIDYMGVEYDPSHIEESAYEKYYFDQNFW